MHFAQLINTGDFLKFDFGMSDNLYYYKTIDSPNIDVSKIKVPIMLVIAERDQIADLKDNTKLASKLENLIKIKEIKGADHVSLV